MKDQSKLVKVTEYIQVLISKYYHT